MDWADEAADDLATRVFTAWVHSPPNKTREIIATALRKAKADGMRASIEETSLFQTSLATQLALASRLRFRASAIEKGME